MTMAPNLLEELIARVREIEHIEIVRIGSRVPVFLPMRVDDESGTLDWLHTANRYGFKPWVGIFPDDYSEAEAAELSALVQSGREMRGRRVE